MAVRYLYARRIDVIQAPRSALPSPAKVQVLVDFPASILKIPLSTFNSEDRHVW